MPEGLKIGVTSTRAILEAAARRGANVPSLLASYGLSEAVLSAPSARLPASIVYPLWDDASAQASEPELAVWAALELPWGAYQVIDFLCAHSQTLGDAITALAASFRIVSDPVRLDLQATEEGGAILSLRPAHARERPSGRYVDYTLAACIFRMSYVTGRAAHPRVSLRRDPPASRDGHERVFGPHLAFGAPSDEARFAPDLWQTPSLSPDPALRDVLQGYADLLKAALPPADPLIEQIGAVLARTLPEGGADLEGVARALGTSSRTLQRRLGEIDLSWREVLERVRIDLATSYLRDPSLSIDQIALKTGYSDTTAFHRAFSRWTGLAPGAWRRLH